mmetsp:Transcript_33868/g.62723  ORF Transcript_33868/g.62723 Transcript_33868/m.62723 type:complete len:99 (+) Transcript_33868:477-773(+)
MRQQMLLSFPNCRPTKSRERERDVVLVVLRSALGADATGERVSGICGKGTKSSNCNAWSISSGESVVIKDFVLFGYAGNMNTISPSINAQLNFMKNSV